MVNYIILPAKEHGSYSYPDLLVTTEESHHNKNWYQIHESQHNDGGSMLTIRQYVDLLALLKSGKAFGGKGRIIDTARLNAILDDIIAVRKPWRAELLDAYFEEDDGVMYINYNHRMVNGLLQAQDREPLEQCLMQDKRPGIFLDHWLKNANSQGLPPKKTRKGNLYYSYPRDGCVAMFCAESCGIELSCGCDPWHADATIYTRSCFRAFILSKDSDARDRLC